VKYNKVMMKTAFIWAEMSYCKRAKVGAVIAKDNRILVASYNGTVSGANNCCEEEKENELVSKNTVVHAEINAIAYAAKNGIKTDDCTIYITLSPCVECSKAIIQCGIKKVFYKTEYRDISGIEFLKENNISVEQIQDI